jgi:hypothetical protein
LVFNCNKNASILAIKIFDITGNGIFPIYVNLTKANLYLDLLRYARCQ